jgi:DNA topoisomerase IA
MRKLIIAEKPDLAKAIGEAINGTINRGDGYFIKGEYTITW